MFSSFFRARDSHNSTSGEDSFVTKTIKRLLVVLKVITSGAQAFFGIDQANRYVLNNPDLTLPANIFSSTTGALFSAGFIAATRAPKMLEPSSKPQRLQQNSDSPLENMENADSEEKSLTFSDLSFFNKCIYSLISTMAYGACFFSSIANYNFAFSLCVTLVALSTDLSSNEEILNYINEDPLFQATPIQLFSFLCFLAQMRSFYTQQLQTAKDFLLKWWFHSENRNSQVSSLGKMNILLLWSFLTYIPGTTFFAVFSTETGLHNLNNSLLKSLFKEGISEDVLDGFVALSALCTIFITTTNTVPSNYNYLSKSNHQNKSLTTTGWFLMLIGSVDNICSAYCTFYGSLKTLSKLFDVDMHNPLLISTSALLMPTNLACNFIYNTHKVVYERHSKTINISGDLEERLLPYSSQLDVLKDGKSIQEPLSQELSLDDSENFSIYYPEILPFLNPPDNNITDDGLIEESTSNTATWNYN